MPKVAFKLLTSIRQNPEDGTIEIDITPDDPRANVTGQMIVDAVSEIVLWQWDNTLLDTPDEENFDA